MILLSASQFGEPFLRSLNFSPAIVLAVQTVSLIPIACFHPISNALEIVVWSIQIDHIVDSARTRVESVQQIWHTNQPECILN